MDSIKKNSVHILQPWSEVYYIRNDEEMAALYAADAAAGNGMTDAGESSAYPRQRRLHLEEPTTLMVVGLTKAPWASWSNKPHGLVRAVITSGLYKGLQVTVTKKTLAKAGTAA